MSLLSFLSGLCVGMFLILLFCAVLTLGVVHQAKKDEERL